MNNYYVNKSLFITESKEYIYISVENNIYRLNNNENIRKRIDFELHNVYRTKKININKITTYLLKIGAIITHKSIKKTSSFKIIMRENSLSEKMRVISKNIIINPNGIKVKVLDNYKKIVLYKCMYFDNFKEYEYNQLFLKYILEVFKDEKVQSILNKINGTICYFIDIENYQNNVFELDISNIDFNIFINDNNFVKLKYDFEKYFPMIVLRYFDIFGNKIMCYGDSKNQCKYNLYKKLLKKGFKFKRILFKESKLFDEKKFYSILEFYFSEINTNNLKGNYGEIWEQYLKK